MIATFLQEFGGATTVGLIIAAVGVVVALLRFAPQHWRDNFEAEREEKNRETRRADTAEERCIALEKERSELAKQRELTPILQALTEGQTTLMSWLKASEDRQADQFNASHERDQAILGALRAIEARLSGVGR